MPLANQRHPSSDRLNVVGLLALRSLNDLELDSLVLVERPETGCLNRRVMHEDVLVLTTVDRDEAVALLGIEPLDGALCHETLLEKPTHRTVRRACPQRPPEKHCPHSFIVGRNLRSARGAQGKITCNEIVSSIWLHGGVTSPTRTFSLIKPPPPAPLNEWAPDQREVLAHSGAPILVTGGPGTGKTEVLIEWVARRATALRLDRMVVLTHSRAAAQRLRMRIVRRLGGAHLAPRVTTIHGLCLGLVRRYADPETWGQLRLLQAPEQEFRLWELLGGHDTSAWPSELAAAAPARAFASQLRPILARARQLGLDPGDVAALGRTNPVWGAVGEFFEEYLTVLDFEQTLDYAELVHRARLIVQDEAVRAAVAASVEALAVDEFSELDPSQLRLLADLCSTGAELLAMADPQQSVFGFRGAEAESLGWFTSTFPHGRVMTLERNHRGGRALVAAWTRLAARLNAAGAPPPSQPAAAPDCRVRALVYDSPAAELSHLAQQLRDAHLRDKVEWSQCAVIAPHRAARAERDRACAAQRGDTRGGRR